MKTKVLCNSPFFGSLTLPLLISFPIRDLRVGVVDGSGGGGGEGEGEAEVDRLGAIVMVVVTVVVVVVGGEVDVVAEEGKGEEVGRGKVGEGGEERDGWR